MKVTIFSEEHRSGVEADWPAIPRIGDVISFKHSGGTSNHGVQDVRWHADTNGLFAEVEIHLTFDEVRSPFDRLDKIKPKPNPTKP